MKTLVLIEGVGKQPSVQKYLGDNYKVVPTFGHIRDLPTKGLGVDVMHNFKPEYVVSSDKKKTVAGILSDYKNSDGVLIATDPDREGEAIAWHICEVLGIDKNSNCRIAFNQIEKKTVQEAAKKPRPIDQKLVDAQQARRVLDRLVGYKLSPILCRKIKSNMSAGRVQSVTLRLVVDRDREIENFKPEEYWTLTALLNKQGSAEVVKATLSIGKDKKVKTKDQMDEILSKISNGTFKAETVKKSVTYSHPSAPFTTSTMQTEAGNKLGMSLKVISSTAQTLYEGATLTTGGKLALVTYIRTDSTRISPEAQAMAKAYIKDNYGEKYLPSYNRVYKNKKDVQDAHEAIRPISLENTPEKMKPLIGKNEYKLYKLIYDRFLASQMADASYNSLSVDIVNNGYMFKTTGRTPIFDGYTALYNNVVEDEDQATAKLPDIQEGDEFEQKELKPEQKFTKPPARYNEGTLVKAMEDKGIGRPATYNQTITVLYNRGYIEKEKGKAIKSTELGRAAVDYLIKHFTNIMDIDFTAQMEDTLDDIEYMGKDWQKVVSEFYGPFEKDIKEALSSGDNAKIPDEESDVICDKCGAKMVIRTGKFGKFLACPNFPKCKNTKPLEEDQPIVVAKCPKCGKNVRRLKSKKGKYFYGCEGYPSCDFVSWDIPANEECPNCKEQMIVKLYSKNKVTSCPKCGFNRRDPIEDNSAEKNEDDENAQITN